ncbi:flagellar biosynthesis protein FlgP [Colwellia sp. C1TZA3]|nr:flagellar biosynthesis protein FlgP [Colwellia sp. C1TZA3]
MSKVNMNTLRNSIGFFLSALMLSACSSVFDKQVEWQNVKPETFPVLTAIGQAPISLQNSQNKTQRMLMAMKASKMAAYAELAEQVYGQNINASTTMANLVLNNQQLQASVRGIIRGAKVVKSYPVGDSYTTELSLDFKDVYEIYNATANRKEIKHISYY